jgi:hypothetical protein
LNKIYYHLFDYFVTFFIEKYVNVGMGGLKKRGCFGAASLKRGEESSKFPIAIFGSTFFFNYLYKIS